MKKIKGNLKFRGAEGSIPKGVHRSSKKFKLLLYQIFCRRLISGRGIVNGRVSYLTICWDSALNPKICKFTLPLLYCRVAIFEKGLWIFAKSLKHFRVAIYLFNRLPGWENWSLFNVFFFIYLYIYFRVENNILYFTLYLRGWGWG